MFDTHLHTQFSTDSKMNASDVAQVAKEQNINIIITEHLDLDYPENPEAFLFDFKEYFATLDCLRSETFLLGVELGLRPECSQENNILLKGQPFDEVIGSVHVVKGIDIYRPEFTKKREKKDAYQEYFVEMLKCIEQFDDFDTLGHVDYICRYARYDDTEIVLEDFYDEWSQICRTLIEKDKALEINTRRLDQKLAVQSLTKLYKRYQELGGKYVTIGSDAHVLGNIGKNFAVAWQMAESLNLQPVYFKQRKLNLDSK